MHLYSQRHLPPVLTPPFVDRSLGIPPANIPPRPGGALTGGGGADEKVAALPALLARALDPGSGGRKLAPGTGGAPLPTGGVELVLPLPSC
jgi:hypothetical protein